MSRVTARNCQFCSVVSKVNGEDPIGTADSFDQWLILETPLPWAKTLWMQPDPISPDVLEAIAPAWDLNLRLRPLAIAPDREYSQPGLTRVLHFRRPAALFTQLEKREYLLPAHAIASLVTALLLQPDALPNFEAYRQKTDHIRDLLICTHGNMDVACARFGYPIYHQLRQHYASDRLRVWRVSHFGYHQFAPTLLDMPEGRCWGHLESSHLDLLVHRTGDIQNIRSFYQGWAGLEKFEQIAEQEILIKEGWDWLNYCKRGKTLAVSDPNVEDPDWADVQIDFVSPDGERSGTYAARIEVDSTVQTMWASGEDQSLSDVKQYRVSRLMVKQ